MNAVQAVQEDEPNAWWTTLKHQGVLLSPIVLEEIFPDGPPSIGECEYEKLRRSYKSFRNDSDELYDWLDIVLEDLLGHSNSSWVKETNVPAEFRRGDLRPNRVLLDKEGEARVMVGIDTNRVTDDDGEPGRIGIYSGKRTYAKFVRLLRETGTNIGILTNGHQFRVVHATLDHESWTEWDAQAWFQGGEGRRALQGFYGLLSDDVLPTPSEDEEESLIGRIKASRDRQADLSDVMGTQVREAVELLLKDLDAILMEMSEEEREEILEPLKERDLSRRDELRARYQASIRIVMRLVVSLYAESRELFPKDNPVYYNSYSVEGLFRDLREARIEEGEDTLEKQYSAWPRLQALSRLVYYGSPHSDVPLRAYGGRLFRPPGEDGDDDVLAGLAVFEDDEIRLSDATILEVLEKLKIAEFKSGGQRRTGPVDFSDLRTEYIGMMYEGLLDYELREASEDDGAILFLNIGDQPALPFNILENLEDKGLEKLVNNLKDNASDSFLADDEVSEDDFDEDELSEDGEETADEDKKDDYELDGFDDDLEARVHQWAKRVVEETGVYMPHFNTVRAMDPTTQEKYENKAARRVVDRIIRPGGTYLVSHSGTRKSTGTFYTPPGLAVPTVHRTLEPLAYEEREDTKVPKKPEEILDLQVCDPAMGSGTFPVSALRYLTDALKESFEEHVFPEIDEGDPIAAPLGQAAEGYLNEQLLTIQKGDDEHWEDKFERQIKRNVVERCIYGVDINPLAVELAKLSLWIETLEPDLPFTFLDHKLRVGNSLIGSWLHEFESYPISAWNREGANKKRSKRIADWRNEIEEQLHIQSKKAVHDTSWFDSGPSIDELAKRAKEAYENIHRTVDEYKREQLYLEEFRRNEDVQLLRHLMNRWCAIWFWPTGTDDTPVLDPEKFYDTNISEDTKDIVDKIADESKHKFFHWEIEFPDVFLGEDWGFNAILGNPPWEEPRPQNEEFFTRYNPAYRTLDKREKDQYKTDLFESSPHLKQEWLDYVEFYENYKYYAKNRVSPFQTKGRKTKKKKKIESYLTSDVGLRPNQPSNSPYKLQEYTVNLWKLFLEKSMYLTDSQGGLGLILPTPLFSGKETFSLRSHVFNNADIQWAYHFVNRQKIFDIHGSTRFSAISLQIGSPTTLIRTHFMTETLEDWKKSEPEQYLEYSMNDIKSFSPNWLNFLEFNNEDTYKMSTKIYDGGDSLAEFIGSGSIGREFYSTGDDDLFIKPENLQNTDGYDRDNRGVWYDEQGTPIYPVYTGSMIHQFDFSFQDTTGGKEGDKIPHEKKVILPENLMRNDVFESESGYQQEVRLCLRRIARATDTWTIISAITPNYPSVESVYFFKDIKEGTQKLFLLGVLNSFIFDYVARQRVDNSASWYILSELPIPNTSSETQIEIARLSAKLNWHPDFFPDLKKYTNGQIENEEYLTDERERAEAKERLDSLVMGAYGLDDSDLEWILRPENDDSRNLWKSYKRRLDALGGSGYWGELDQ
mgnify:CR=1 FL=1